MPALRYGHSARARLPGGDDGSEHMYAISSCGSEAVEPKLYYAIGDYLLAHIERHGVGRSLPPSETFTRR